MERTNSTHPVRIETAEMNELNTVSLESVNRKLQVDLNRIWIQMCMLSSSRIQSNPLDKDVIPIPGKEAKLRFNGIDETLEHLHLVQRGAKIQNSAKIHTP